MQEHRQLLDRVLAAGDNAAAACQPTPMIVGNAVGLSDRIDPAGPIYIVPVGFCGFAGVVIKPATGSFARWLGKNKIGHKNYYGGWYLPAHPRVSGAMVQSYEINRAAAAAMAAELQAAGIKCYVESRLD
jgi:hypothetical protein